MVNQKLDKLSSPRFENLNGLRFIGAFAVFLFHSFTLGNETWGDFYQDSWFGYFTKAITKGHHGVGLFFVLSGFLITYLLLHEAKKNARINVVGFFMRRLLRIWPLYFVIVLFGFLVFPYLPPYDTPTSNSLALYSLFLSNFEEIWNGWRDAASYLSITWSVSVEEQYYIGWVLLMMLIPPFRKGKFFFLYFTILILISLVFRYSNMDHEREIYYSTFSVISDLAIGGYLSYLCFHFNIQDRLKHLSKPLIFLIYAIGLIGILVSRQIFVGELMIFERLAIALFFAFIIFEQAYCLHSFYKADRIKGFYRLGEVSYGFYMYHCFIIFYMQHLVTALGWESSIFGFLFFLVMSFICTAIISVLSYNYLELPFLRLKKYFR